jgi:hypothetical protein
MKREDTTVKLPPDFSATMTAPLETPPPPAGHPSTRKKKQAKTKRK